VPSDTRAHRSWRAVHRALRALEEALILVGSVVMTVALLAEWVARQGWGQTLLGSNQIALYGAVALTLAGLARASADDAHLRPAWLQSWWPWPVPQRLCDGIAAALYGALCWFAGVYVLESMAFDQRVPVLYWPLWTVQWLLPLALGGSALHYLAFCCQPELKPQRTPC
jgi:TRAP-type C4-dicarboxylate transport system permease small subunit